MSEIKAVYAREILDSRGNPTVEVEVESARGVFGRASVPSGASTGSGEALELRDGDMERFSGKGVRKALRNVEEIIAPEITGMDLFDQCGIDQTMIGLDGSSGKTNLGANAILAVSLACARTAAMELGLPLYRYLGGVNARTMPVPMMNVFNGGLHSDAGCACQEFMLRSEGAEDFSHALQMGLKVVAALRELLKGRGLSTAVGDEGGFAPAGFRGGTRAVLELLTAAMEKAGVTPGKDMTIALDMASTSFFRNGVYDYTAFEPEGKILSAEEQIKFLQELVSSYPVDSIEDGLAENEWASWAELTEKAGSRCQLVGDDLFVTSPERLRQGIRLKCANAILLKPNQIGTLTECCDTAALARNNGYRIIVSHRSGETCDPFIADLAVALGGGEIKAGAPVRGERVAKYNQLLRIEEQLSESALYGIRK